MRDDPGRSPQIELEPGEKFLMAHFPATPSMSRLARSSGTQKVCETTKSRNRTEASAGAKVARATRPPTR